MTETAHEHWAVTIVDRACTNVAGPNGVTFARDEAGAPWLLTSVGGVTHVPLWVLRQMLEDECPF